MTKYPLTYAVFYRSIIEPQTQLRQYDVNHALFLGSINIADTHPDYISKVIGNGYVSGNKTIRSNLIQNIQNMTPEELVPRIQLLGLQDIPVVLSVARNLLTIVDISDSLRDRLLEKADTTSEEQFLAELFQQSLKCHNMKLKLSKDNKEFLNHLAEYDDIDLDVLLDNIHYDTTPPQEAEKVASTHLSEDSFCDHSIIAPFATIYDEVKYLIYQIRHEELYLPQFDGDSVYWKHLRLPIDFKYLIASVTPLLTDKDNLIPLDFADVASVCHLDLNTKACINGHIEILEVFCPKNNISIFTNALRHVSNCLDALLHITGNVNLSEAMEISEILQNHITPDANLIFGAQYSKYMKDRYHILVICYIPDSVKEENNCNLKESSFSNVNITKRSPNTKSAVLKRPHSQKKWVTL